MPHEEDQPSERLEDEVEEVNVRKRRKIKVMEASGQTDEERRKLRQSYRKLANRMNSKSDAIEDPNQTDVFVEIRSENNALFDQVRYTREAVLDGDNLDRLASSTAKQVDKLVEVPRYDPNRLIQKLRSKCCMSNQVFDWALFGRESGACYNAVPSRVQFLTGPLEADFEPVQRQRNRRKAEKKEEDEAEEENPEQVKNQETNANQLSAVERNIVELSKVLKKECKRQQKRDLEEMKEMEGEGREQKRLRSAEVSMVQFLFNPKSFTQTVENIFHASFLVKHGQAQLAVRENGPTIKLIRTDAEEFPRSRQAIISLDMRDWRKLTKANGVTQSMVPHRKAERNEKD